MATENTRNTIAEMLAAQKAKTKPAVNPQKLISDTQQVLDTFKLATLPSSMDDLQKVGRLDRGAAPDPPQIQIIDHVNHLKTDSGKWLDMPGKMQEIKNIAADILGDDLIVMTGKPLAERSTTEQYIDEVKAGNIPGVDLLVVENLQTQKENFEAKGMPVLSDFTGAAVLEEHIRDLARQVEYYRALSEYWKRAHDLKD